MTAELAETPPSGITRIADRLSQATAVEQARAVAEVQAAVVVAQQCPRDMDRALADMRDVCGRLTIANRAFYDVRNRGTGPSVHLARELARIWGNVDYGVRELRRDDDAGESEIQAFAWDQQTNVRSTRSFIMPHARMKTINGVQTRQKLIDLGDIYLSNQNIGARAVRECIFGMLPSWFTEEAQDRCRATLENGEGVPLQDRVTNMIAKFAEIGVKVDQIEQRVGAKKGAWTGQNLADLAITYTSITRDGIDKDDEFPTAAVTAAEITGKAAPDAEPIPETPEEQAAEAATDQQPDTDGAGGDLITPAQLAKLHIQLGENGLGDRDEGLAYLSGRLGRDITTSKDISKDEASRLIDAFENDAWNDDTAEPPLDAQ